jgi:hypothetical protein
VPFEPHLRLHLTLPQVRDLSGRLPFSVIAQISRTRQGDEPKQETPISVLADGTSLDISSVWHTGILRILPMNSFHDVDRDAEACCALWRAAGKGALARGTASSL